MKLVLRLGGHALFRENCQINITLIKDYASILRTLKHEGHTLHVVVGGGNVARQYINVLSKLNASNALKDYLGILITRANALMLIASLGDIAYRTVPKDYEDLLNALNSNKIIVCGGLQPGQSTLAVAALIAETIKADYLLNATNVDGVYSSDPRKDPNARLIKKLTISELRRILETEKMPGTYKLFDNLSLDIIERSKIKVIVFNGTNPNNLLRIVHGESIGTLIIP